MSPNKVNPVNPQLIAHIEKNVLPHYELNDSAHDITHMRDVLARSNEIAKNLPHINYDIVYALAAFHDIGYHIDQKGHEKFGANALLSDGELKKFFSEEDIQMMARELSVHDTKVPDSQRGLYGRILCSADLDDDLDMVLKRLYHYRTSYSPEMSLEEVVDDGYKFLSVLTAPDSRGYLDKMYFDIPKFEEFRRTVGQLLADRAAFRKKFLSVNGL